MALYSIEEICDGCLNARWHICKQCYGKPSFCHCIIRNEGNIRYTDCYCDIKTVERREEPRKEGQNVQKGI